MTDHYFSHWRDRLRASGIHFGVSVAVALPAAALVFGLWYPFPYRDISGGRQLFFILMAVDVVLGPLITLSIFNRAKPLGELKRDMALVVLIQLGALVYGLWAVYVARPVHLVFEYDRFRVVHAVDIPQALMSRVPKEIDATPLTGPTSLSLRQFKDSNESMEATMAALGGLSLSARPELWQPYSAAKNEILKTGKPISELITSHPSRAAEIQAAIETTGQSSKSLIYIPMIGRNSFWTVLLDAETTEIRAFFPLDSF